MARLKLSRLLAAPTSTETVGRATTVAATPHHSTAQAAEDSQDEADAMSVDTFCRRNGISRGTFYNMMADGRGPKVMRARSRVLISSAAAAEWRRALEAASKQ
jgi:hypothetical protein